MTWRRISWLLVWIAFSSCNEQDEDSPPGSPNTSPSGADQHQAAQIAQVASGMPISSGSVPPIGNGNLAVLGGEANENQAAFRQYLGVASSAPTPDQMAQWQQYNVRLTEYSNQDADWQSPTAASTNWEGTTQNGDPLNLAGTSVAVDFTKIPRGSLLYLPALNMYAEANDTGATGLWSRSDAGQSDYGANGAGRVDVYNDAGNRTAGQVETQFNQWVGQSDYGTIYVVYSGPGWKH